MTPIRQKLAGPRAGWTSFVLAAAFVWGGLSGCADSLMAGHPCVSHGECPLTQQCILGECMAVPDFEVDVEVFPIATSDYFPQPFRGVDLSSPDALRLDVPRPTVVRGSLLLGMEPYPGSARLTFNPTPGLSRTLSPFTTDVGNSTTVSTFEIRLVGTMQDRGQIEAIAYTVSGRPLDSNGCCSEADLVCPAPLVMNGLRFRTDTDDLVLAFADRPTRISGVLVATDEHRLPKSGVQVQAFDSELGRYSLPSVTDVMGRFCLALDLPPTGTDAEILIKLSSGSADQLAPTIEETLTVTAGESNDDVVLQMGDYGRPSTVTGQLVDQRGHPIPGANVIFTGEVATGGTFSTSTSTNVEDGSFSALLLGGTYRIRAVPPAGSAAGILEVDGFEVDASSGDEIPSPLDERRPAPDRTALTGRVVMPTQANVPREPAPEVDVIAEIILSNADEVGIRRRFTTATDEDGDFELLLDPGEYRLHFRPAPAASLPWVVGPQVTLEPFVTRDLGSVVLEHGTLFHGKALGQIPGATEPLPGAKIEVHARRHDASLLLWEGRADDDGSFEVLLPTSLIGKVEATGPREDPDDDLR